MSAGGKTSGLYFQTNRDAPHRRVLASGVVQVQVPADDVQLDPQQDHQHAGAVHRHDGAGEAWSEASVTRVESNQRAHKKKSSGFLFMGLFTTSEMQVCVCVCVTAHDSLMIFRSSQISSLLAGL